MAASMLLRAVQLTMRIGQLDRHLHCYRHAYKY